MNIGLYQSASALSALERWQDAVAQNITAGQVMGYRKRTVEFSAQPAGEWRLDTGALAQDESTVPAQFPTASNGISFMPGETQPTGRDLDVAIQGQGFFEVQQPDGTVAYTRGGEFTTRADHMLVTAGNLPVLSDAGSPIILQSDGKVTINPDGSIVQGTTTISRLGVQTFSNLGALLPISGGLFAAGPGADAQPVLKPQVLQGALESSNVKPMREMVNLVLISRAYDANQRVIVNGDDEMEKTLQALG